MVFSAKSLHSQCKKLAQNSRMLKKTRSLKTTPADLDPPAKYSCRYSVTCTGRAVFAYTRIASHAQGWWPLVFTCTPLPSCHR